MITRSDRKVLEKIGITRRDLQVIAKESVPCGMSILEALKDKTLWQTNAPRALVVCYWKGLVYGLALSETAGRSRHVNDVE